MVIEKVREEADRKWPPDGGSIVSEHTNLVVGENQGKSGAFFDRSLTGQQVRMYNMIILTVQLTS